jgi:hypothetical protein
VLLQVHMIAAVDIVVGARDQKCWRKRRIARQRNLVEAVIVREENQEVHDHQEGIASRQSSRAEVGNFGRREGFLTRRSHDLLFILSSLLARLTNERAR